MVAASLALWLSPAEEEPAAALDGATVVPSAAELEASAADDAAAAVVPLLFLNTTGVWPL